MLEGNERKCDEKRKEIKLSEKYLWMFWGDWHENEKKKEEKACHLFWKKIKLISFVVERDKTGGINLKSIFLCFFSYILVKDITCEI